MTEYLCSCNTDSRILNIAIPDDYVEHGNVDILRREVGIDEESIVKRIVTEYISLG